MPPLPEELPPPLLPPPLPPPEFPSFSPSWLPGLEGSSVPSGSLPWPLSSCSPSFPPPLPLWPLFPLRHRCHCRRRGVVDSLVAVLRRSRGRCRDPGQAPGSGLVSGSGLVPGSGLGTPPGTKLSPAPPPPVGTVLGSEPVLALAGVPVVAVQQVGVGRPGGPVVDGLDHRSLDMGLPRLDERLVMQKVCQQRGWRGWGGLRDPGTS